MCIRDRSNNNEKPPVKVDIKDKDGNVIGHKKIYSGSSEYKDASQGKGIVTTPSEMGTDVTGVNVKTGNIIKKDDKKEVKPEVKPETYLGKDQGLLNKADWLKKTSRSPAAKSGAFSDDQRWAQQLKHRQWQKDNNRGKFKVKDNPDTPGNEAKQASKDAAFARRNKRLTDKGLKPITKKVKTPQVEVPSKFAANKDKPTFQRRDQKLLDKGLKPPTYTKKVDAPKVEPTKPLNVETPKVEIPKTKPVMVDTPKVDKKKTFQNKITAESFAGKVLAKGTGELAKRVAKKMAGTKDSAPQDAPDAPAAPSRPDKGPAPSRPDKAPNAPSRPKPSTGPSGGESQRKKESLPKPKQSKPAPDAPTASTKRESYDAYDLVLNYIMETEQASSIEEANYIMLEMDQNTIHEIVVEQKKTLDEGIKTAVGLGMLALPYVLNKFAKPKVDKMIDNKRKTSPIGGENRKEKIKKATGVDLDNW